MSNHRLIIVTGLQRSGNHAIIEWIVSLFPSACFFNDQPHDLFYDVEKLEQVLRAAADANCLVVSFEDSVKHSINPNQPLLEELVPLLPHVVEGREVRYLYVLRDPYNTWASRLAARARVDGRKPGLTSDPAWQLFRTNWLAIAQHQAIAPDNVILFNRWKEDATYRRSICASIGGEYSEVTLDRVPATGFGSSFEGKQRPTYGQIFARIPSYASPAFFRAFSQRPAEYLRILVKPRIKGKQLKVNERYNLVQNCTLWQIILEDDTIRAESLRIFGFSLKKDGSVISQEA
jgi:hypothetical protein